MKYFKIILTMFIFLISSPSFASKWYYGQGQEQMLGVMIDRVDNKVVITKILPGSRAEAHKFKRGMIISKINGHDVSDRNLWYLGKDLTHATYTKTVEINGIEYARDYSYVDNINYTEIYPKVYLDLASINIKNGCMFFYIKYLNGNKLLPINNKNIYYYENAYIIDFVNNKYAEIETNAYGYNQKYLFGKILDSEVMNKVRIAGFKPTFLGYKEGADYSGLDYMDIIPNSSIESLRNILNKYIEKSKQYKNNLDFQGTLRFF